MKLLIVDDETYTREGLRDLLGNAVPQLDSIAVAEDGRSALEAASREVPDILLCDIRMPGMDGIELAQAVRGIAPDCQILMMSGYSDREYIKGALDVRALAFIDKPIDEQDLLQAVRGAMERVCEVRKRRESADAAKSLLYEELARALMRGDALGDGRFRDMLPPGGGAYVCLLVSPPNVGDTPLPALLARRGLWGVCAADGKGCEALLVQLSCEAALTPLCAAVAALDDGIKVAAGSPEKSPDELSESYRRAQAAMATLFYRSSMRIAYSGGTSAAMELSPSLGDFVRALELGGQEPYDRLEELHDKLLEHDATPPDLTRMHYHALLSAALKDHEDLIAPALESLGRDSLWDACMSAPSLEALERILWDVLAAIENRHERERDDSYVITAARRYIHRHCQHELLQLKDIADHVHMSGGHLSALFKRSTGYTLHQYITHCRIERACELLSNTNAKNQEIASQVGYGNAYYFGKVFQRETGLTPQQYRSK